MSTWDVTTAMVFEVTKRTVSDDDILMAGEIIDLYSNRTQEASGSMRTRDITWLKKAVCWQAVKCNEEPDLASKMMVQEFTQDGVNVKLSGDGKGGAEWYAMLNPFAARALKNLSWKGTRSLAIPRSDVPLGPVVGYDFLNESSDNYGRWEPI